MCSQMQVGRLIAAAVVLHLACAPGWAGDATPLFASESIIRLRIEAPFEDLIRKAPRATDPFDAKVKLLGSDAEEHAITLAARGISRRKTHVCDFPPLRIRFKAKPEGKSLFKGQKTIKLSTHCRGAPSFQDYSLLEYTAYRLYNVLTPQSFRVRLAEVDYVETRTGSLRIRRYGFLIEDADDMAKRNDLKKLETTRIERAQLSASATARSDLFQYMIGNLDWSNIAASKGSECCHNVKLLGVEGAGPRNLIPVPYDFDSSGFVNPPYAMVPPSVPVSSVRTRYFRGYCEFNSQVNAAAAEALAMRDALLATVAATPQLSERARTSAGTYLTAFFQRIANPQEIKRRIIVSCRK